MRFFSFVALAPAMLLAVGCAVDSDVVDQFDTAANDDVLRFDTGADEEVVRNEEVFIHDEEKAVLLATIDGPKVLVPDTDTVESGMDLPSQLRALAGTVLEIPESEIDSSARPQGFDNILPDLAGSESDAFGKQQAFDNIAAATDSFQYALGLPTQQDVSYTSWVAVSSGDVGQMICKGDRTCLTNRFAQKIGSGTTKPINVCMNGWMTTGSGSTWHPCNLFAWKVNRRLRVNDVITGVKGALTSNYIDTAGTRFDNISTTKDMPIGQLALWENEVATTTSWSVSATAGVTVTGSVGLPFGIAEGEISVNLQAEAAAGGQKTTTWKANYYNSPLTLKPRTYVILRLKQQYALQPRTYNVPMELSGQVGADYANGWNGHHAWAIDANTMFPEYSAGTEKYTVKESKRRDHVIWVEAKVYAL